MISLHTFDIILIALYFVLIVWIGLRAARRNRTEEDFLLAGRTLTLPMFVATLVSTWYGGILGVGEFSYLYGVSNWFVFGFPYYVFALVFAFFLAGKIRATKFATIPDQLEHAYGRKTAILGGVLTFFLSSPAPYVLMLGFLTQVLFGFSLTISVLLTTLLSVVFILRGGFTSTVRTNVAQFGFMYIGFALLVLFSSAQYGGLEFIRAHVPPLHLTLTGGNSWQYIVAWFFIALWTLVDPAFHQRCYAAKDERTARRGILVSVVFWFFFDMLTSVSGLYARALSPGLEQPALAYLALSEKVLPPVAKGLFFIGLFATIMSTLTSLTLIGGITIGRDIAGRLKRGFTSAREEHWTRAGMFLSAGIAVVLALLVPSVVSLWYVIGTAMIPGLLLPVVASYYPRIRVGGKRAFVAMLAGWLVSTGSLIWGQWFAIEHIPEYPFGVEPMYPGLLASLAVWGTGLIKSRRQMSLEATMK